MENRKIHKNSNVIAAVIAAFALLAMTVAVVFGVGNSGIMTAKAETRAIGGATNGTATCMLRNRETGEEQSISVSYEYTSSDAISPEGGVETIEHTVLTLPASVTDDETITNITCTDSRFSRNSTGTFTATGRILLMQLKKLVFEYTAVMSLPEEPTKEGYRFVGWYLDEDLTIPYNGEPITSDMSFYPKFEINTYTVTLDSNGGSDVSNVTVEWNTAAELPTPTKEGYNFLGWFYGNGTKYEGQAVTENITLTAHWELKVYTVTFYVDGEVYKTVEVPHGTLLRNVMSQDKALRYMNALNEKGEKLPKTATVKGNAEVAVEEMTEQEKTAEFLSRNMWFVYSLGGIACAGVLSTVIASVIADKRK